MQQQFKLNNNFFYQNISNLNLIFAKSLLLCFVLKKSPLYIQKNIQRKKSIQQKTIMIQQFQQFWHNKLSHLDSQLLLDYDTFITIFTNEIKNQTSIQLTQLQQQIIKRQIDPQNQNQVYKNGYLLFIKNFWGIASQRTKFFNMKINLNKLRGQVQGLSMAGSIHIKITYQSMYDTYNQQKMINKTKTIDQYVIKNDTVCLIKSNNPTKICNKVQQLSFKGFIKIGSSITSNIVVPSSSINQNHVKLIYATNLQQKGKSTASFIVKPEPVNKVFIRDVSTSNRVKYVIDNDNKYFIVKAGMIISGIGLMDGIFQIIVQTVPVAQVADINSFLQSANADRKSFMIGQPDKPLKTIKNLDMDSITQSQITDLYDRNLYYPQLKPKPTKKQQKIRMPLKLVIKNKRTLQQQKYDSKNSKTITIGRDTQRCDVIIDHISIRPIQFVFECINNIWFIRRVKGRQHDKLNNIVSVYLSKDINRCSNRLQLSPVYPQKFVIKDNVEIEINIVDRQHKKDQDQY